MAVLAGVAAAYLGGTAATPLMVSIKPALIGIGAIAIAFAMNDVLGFTGPRLRLGWLLSHFAGMIAAYISAVTAFIVINAHDVPMLLRWAVPSALGATTIAGFTLALSDPGLSWRPASAGPARVRKFLALRSTPLHRPLPRSGYDRSTLMPSHYSAHRGGQSCKL